MKKIIKLFLICFSHLSLAVQSEAFAISPLPYAEMHDGATTVSLTKDEGRWRADLYEVRVIDGQHVMAAVDVADVEVQPRIFTAPANILIATTKKPDGNKELFYRLVLRPQEKPLGGLNYPLGVNLPVFQRPTSPHVKYECSAGRILKNTGNTHIKGIAGNEIIYVLPGASVALPAEPVFDGYSNVRSELCSSENKSPQIQAEAR